MCEFISWIETKKGNVYLTKEDLIGKRFREYKKYNSNWQRDIKGHGAIRYFYGENIKGREQECVDFSSADNFPKDIVRDIKKRLFEGIGICADILNKVGLKEYNKIKQLALKEYKKIRQLAWEEYEKIRQPALKEYEKIKQLAWEEYLKIRQLAFWSIVKQKKYRNKEWK